jgi:spore germination cell wall hydrolase CwlJ-like protein
MTRMFRLALAIVAMLATISVSGCALFPFGRMHLTERECLMRAMFFESDRSSEDGMLAVGTVVMNRVGQPGYPGTICGVVGQPGQFADGVLDRNMSGPSVALASAVAGRVLAGERNPVLHYVQHFHTAGLTFPYTNMHYVLVAGGNAFYEKW